MKIVACNSNRPLAEAVAATLGLSLTNASVRRFADMEVFVEIHENIRGEDVFVVQLNEIPAGTLNQYWGDVAAVVAREAAGGVRDVILTQSGRR